MIIGNRTRRVSLESAGRATSLAWLAVGLLLLPGCEKRTGAGSSGNQPAASNAGSPTPAADTARPAWVERSRFWPRVMQWTLDSSDEVRQDDLLFRLRGSVVQNFTGGPKDLTHPIMCGFDMTVRPIPTWPHAKGLVLDSIRFRDPVRNVMLPALPMLSSERVYDQATVRTRFTNNLVRRYTPELTDGQLLEPTAYFTWDHRTIIVSARPLPIRFMYETGAPGLESDSAWQWGPGGSG